MDDIWVISDDATKEYIIQEERKRFLMKAAKYFTILTIFLLLFVLCVAESHFSAKKDIMQDILGYDPSHPPVIISSDYDIPDIHTENSEMGESLDEYVYFHFDQLSDYHEAQEKEKEEIEKQREAEIAEAEKQAKQEIRMEYIVKYILLVVGYLLILGFFVWIRYRRYHLFLTDKIEVTIGKCIGKKCNRSRYAFRNYISVRLKNERTINDIRVNSFLYNYTEHNDPLLVARIQDKSEDEAIVEGVYLLDEDLEYLIT